MVKSPEISLGGRFWARWGRSGMGWDVLISDSNDDSLYKRNLVTHFAKNVVWSGAKKASWFAQEGILYIHYVCTKKHKIAERSHQEQSNTGPLVVHGSQLSAQLFCQQHRHQKELEFGRQQIGKFINKVPNKAVHNKCAIRGPCVDLRMHMGMIPLSFARCCRSSWAVWRGSFGILTQPDFLSIHFTDTATPNWIKSKSWKPGFYLTTKIEEKIISIYSRFHHFSHLEVVFATDHPGACQEETHMLMTQLRGEIAAELRQMHRQELNNFSLQKLGRDWLEPPIG